jgi:protein-S-isoprenylcysteine O-methyltransferase Ste14
MSTSLIIHAVFVLSFRLSLSIVRFEAFAIDDESEIEPKKIPKAGTFQKLLRRYVYFFWSFWMFQALALTFQGIAVKLPFIFLVLQVFDFPFREIIGLSLMFLGLLCYAWAFITFQKYLKSKSDGILSSGLYRLIRHPLYTGTIVTLTGSLITLPTPMFLGSSLLCFLAFHLEAKTEETEMEQRYGTMYLEYKKKTKKLIPFIY